MQPHATDNHETVAHPGNLGQRPVRANRVRRCASRRCDGHFASSVDRAIREEEEARRRNVPVTYVTLQDQVSGVVWAIAGHRLVSR
jgi:hypothetical protein